MPREKDCNSWFFPKHVLALIQRVSRKTSECINVGQVYERKCNKCGLVQNRKWQL